MRKWLATVALGTLVAMPLYAQQKNTNTGSNAPAKSEARAGETANAGEFNIAPAAKNLFALPAAPAPKPADIFTDWENNPWNKHHWGLLTPKYELAGMFSYINFCPCSFPNFNQYGATGSFTYNASKYLGLTAEVGGYHFNRDVYVLNGDSYDKSSLTGGMQTYMFGPRLNLRRFNYFVPFAEFLVGAAHAGAQMTGTSGQTSFALAAGGGVDVILMKNLAWRFAQIDYLMTNFSGTLVSPEARQNNLRLGTGLVLRWGYPPAPPKPNHPPTASCSADASSVYFGSTDPVGVHVNGADLDNDPLTYSYTATGGTVDGTGPNVRWNPSGLAMGNYTINAKVDDGRGGTATCSSDIAVSKRPNRNPVISCAPERNPIIAGERVTIVSTASDPDNDPLTYSYSASAGQISGNGARATYDSTGLNAGSYTITCNVSDGQGGTASARTTVDVQKPMAPPQATKIGDCGYTKVGAGRFDNACKRVGDDVALRLKNEPNSKLVIVGYADPKEPKAAKLAETRADGAKKYLGEKGIDASRISTRTGTASTQKGDEKANRRVDFIFVPEGATY